MPDIETDCVPIRCPDCACSMRMLSGNSADGLEQFRWICTVAMEAKNRGFLGQPRRRHKECLVYKLCVPN